MGSTFQKPTPEFIISTYIRHGVVAKSNDASRSMLIQYWRMFEMVSLGMCGQALCSQTISDQTKYVLNILLINSECKSNRKSVQMCLIENSEQQLVVPELHSLCQRSPILSSKRRRGCRFSFLTTSSLSDST